VFGRFCVNDTGLPNLVQEKNCSGIVNLRIALSLFVAVPHLFGAIDLDLR
jgi:hypothetical protein